MGLTTLGKKYLWYIIGAVVGIVFLIIFWVVWSSIGSKISADNTKHASNAQQIANLESTYQQEKTYQKLSPTITKKLLQFEQAVPAAPDFEVLVTELNQLAQATNVDLKQISYSGETTVSSSSSGSGLTPITVNIDASGGAANLAGFLSAFYNPTVFPRLLIVQQYSFTPPSANIPAQLSIVATGYYSSLSQPINSSNPSVP